MYPIVRKETLADNIILMDIKAPRVLMSVCRDSLSLQRQMK